MTARALLVAILLVLALAQACTNEDVLDPNIVPSPEPAIFVVNSSGWTLSRILLADGTVTRDAVLVGAVPQTIALTDDGKRGYVASSSDNQIDVVDLDQLRVLYTIDIGPGSNPYGIVLAGDQAYVSCFVSDEVVRVDLERRAVVRRIPVGRGPEGLLRLGEAANGSLYVTLTNFQASGVYGAGGVVVLDVAADSVRARLVVGMNPQALALAPDGTVHVICTGNYGIQEGRVFVIDPAVPAVVDSLDLGGSPGAIAILPDGRGMAAGYSGGLRIYDRGKRSVRLTRALGTQVGLSALAIDPVTGFLYVANATDSAVHVVDLGADSVRAVYAVGLLPVHLAIRR